LEYELYYVEIVLTLIHLK